MDLASTFAEDARRLKVPTTMKLDGGWWKRDLHAWNFPVSYTWTKGAGYLEVYPTITKKGRLVRVGVPPQRRPVKSNSIEGNEQVTPLEVESVRQALDAYLRKNTPPS